MRQPQLLILTGCAALGLVVGSNTGHADSPPTRDSAAAHAAAGEFVECGRDYMVASEQLTNTNEAAESLLAGAVCFEKAKLVGLAIAALSQIDRKHAQAKLAPRAQLWLASLNEGVAFFARAAEAYESFAKRNSGNPEAPIALSRAIELRQGLGQASHAIRLIDTMIKKYGRKRPTQVAELVLTKAQLHLGVGSQARAERALNDYLKTHAKTGGDKAAAQIHSRLGQLIWERSCPGRSSAGLCVVRRPKKQRAKTAACSSSALPAVTIRARKKALAAKAREHFEAALKLDDTGVWASSAKLALADAELEQTLRTAKSKMPRMRFDNVGNHVGNRAGSNRSRLSAGAFQKWLTKQTKLQAKFGARYAEIVKKRHGRWSQTAAVRVAEMAEGLAAELGGAPMPRLGRGISADLAKDMRKAYCNALDDATKPLVEHAVSAYRYGYSDGSDRPLTKRCELGLLRLSPKTFSRNDERVPTPGAVGDMTAHSDILQTKSDAPSKSDLPNKN